MEEFHALSPVAPYVPGSVAMKLQSFWDTGVKLVSLLDER